MTTSIAFRYFTPSIFTTWMVSPSKLPVILTFCAANLAGRNRAPYWMNNRLPEDFVNKLPGTPSLPHP